MINMQINLIEGALVTLLFAGYLILWKVKKNVQKKQTGVDPEVMYSDTRPSQKYFVHLSRLMIVSIISLIGLHMFEFINIPGFIRIDYFNGIFFDMIGFGIGLSGLLMCLIAQINLGSSWRVGIDRKKKTKLITTGIFSITRNPTYCGLFILCAGVWMIFPTTSFLTWILIFMIMIEFQVRLEEEFLIKMHNEEYRLYCSKTKRYIPLVY